MIFFLEVGLVLIFSFFHEGTIVNELFPLLGKTVNISYERTFSAELFLLRGKNKKHLNKNQANKQQENLSSCKVVLAQAAAVRPLHHFSSQILLLCDGGPLAEGTDRQCATREF